MLIQTRYIREHAPIALLAMGAKAVPADSFARIFYRNAVKLGEQQWMILEACGIKPFMRSLSKMDPR